MNCRPFVIVTIPQAISSPWLYMPEQISISKSTAEFLLQRLSALPSAAQ